MSPLLSQFGLCLLKPVACGSAHRSWLARLPQLLTTPQQAVELQPDDADFLWGLFDQYVDRGLAFVKGRCAQAMPTPGLSQVASLSRLLQVGQSWMMTLVVLFTMQPAGFDKHSRGAGTQAMCTALPS